MKETIGYKLTYGAVKLLALLPFWALYGLSSAMCFIAYYVVRYRRKVVWKNLRLVYPEMPEKELRQIERGFYRNLCDVFVEAVKLLHISDKQVAERIEIRGGELIDECARRGRSAVVMLGHVGNWEWIPVVASSTTEPVIFCQIYHPLRNKVMDRLMLKIRSRFGTESIPMKRTVRRLFEIERDGGHFVCGFIADQRPFTQALHHWTTFLGQDTPYVTGGETIGDHVGAEYYYIDVEKPRRGHYRLTFKAIAPIDDGKENPYTRAYLRMLEQTIHRDPTLWLWSHNRWKRKRASTNEK